MKEFFVWLQDVIILYEYNYYYYITIDSPKILQVVYCYTFLKKNKVHAHIKIG